MLRGRRPWLALIAVALTIVLDVVGGACLPLLARDPRVTEGVSGRFSAAFPIHSRPDSITGGTPFPNPAVVGLSYGWAPDSARYPAWELTVSVPFALFVPQPDAYMQLPHSLSGSLDIGAGASYSWMTQSMLPYVAIGWLDARRSGPLMLAGYSYRGYPFYAHRGDPGSVLTATFAYQFPTGAGTSQVFVQGVSARRDARCDSNVIPPCSPSTGSWSATAGLSYGIQYNHRP